MVYRRKTTRGSYGVENLQQAVRRVKAGEISKRKAETLYGVPRKTITRHIKGQVKKVGSLGRYDCDLGQHFERALVAHVQQLQSMMFGINTVELRKVAYDLAEKQKLSHRFKNNIAGKTWLRGFLARHSDLAIRTPEATSLGRAVGFNRPCVEKFFELYKAELEKHPYSASNIYNMDETGLTVVHKPRKVLAKKGMKQVGRVTSGEKGETTTIVCAVNAVGNYIPPMMIFKRKRMHDILLKGAPPGTIGCCSPNGWIDGQLFLKWLQHFISFVHPTPDNKVILIMDGHMSHKSIEAVEMARSNGVVMVCLPPHTTHRLQPLDVTVYGPLKVNYNTECDKFMLSNPGRRITTYDLGGLFGAAYVRTATMQKAVTGFQSTGIWPINPDIFTDADFLPSTVTEEPQPAEHVSAFAYCY